MTKEEKAYVEKLEKAVKKIPDIYYQGALDKEWGLSSDELDIKQDKYQKQIDKLIKPRKMWIVELHNGCYLAKHSGGDPSRTTLRFNAKKYGTEKGAKIALGLARRFRNFEQARILPVR